MTFDSTFLNYFFTASPVVKIVLFILLLASLISWIIIFQRGFFLRWAMKELIQFEDKFWSSADLTNLYKGIESKKDKEGLARIFVAGFKEFIRLRKRQGIEPDAIMEGAQRAMRVAHSHVADELESNLSFLATVGSTSPYVGLFGTVWGIMMAFHALGNVQQATIAMVAPGISEALVATAMGLFAAIPAVIAFNRYNNRVARILNRYEAFEEEFSSYLYRQAHYSSYSQELET